MSRLPTLVRALLPGAILLASSAAWAGPYGATYSVGSIAPFAAGEVRVIDVAVTNTGGKEWTYEFCKDRTAFGLAYHWDGPVPVFEGERSYIPKTVKPGESITLSVPVAAPAFPGSYTLRFDMVEEGKDWFSLSADKVPTQNVPLLVNPKPAAGKLTDVAFNYQAAAPGLPTLKVIPVGNDCPFDLDFGDGQTTTEKDKSGAGVFHTYAAIGTVPVTVKAKAPCTGTASRQLSVVSGASICWLLPLVIQVQGSTVIGFPGLFRPKITVALPANAGISAVVMGDFFGKEAGALEAEGNFGPKHGQSLSLKIVAWSPQSISAWWPDDLAGAPDQTIRMRVVDAGGQASDWVETGFKGRRTVELIPAFLAQGSCEDGTACTQCGDHSDDDCFFSPSQGTISASHISTPVACVLGGGSGKDTWTLTLKNGWELFATQVGATYTFGSEFTPCNPAFGSTSFTCTIPWEVGGCETLFYSINFFARGPVGVPMS